jgi:hypothetical protein
MTLAETAWLQTQKRTKRYGSAIASTLKRIVTRLG